MADEGGCNNCSNDNVKLKMLAESIIDNYLRIHNSDEQLAAQQRTTAALASICYTCLCIAIIASSSLKLGAATPTVAGRTAELAHTLEAGARQACKGIGMRQGFRKSASVRRRVRAPLACSTEARQCCTKQWHHMQWFGGLYKAFRICAVVGDPVAKGRRHS